MLVEEYDKLRHASNRDVHDNSKDTTLPIAREIVETYVADAVKLPWYIDLLNINLGVHDVAEARRRIEMLRTAFRTDGTRITENLDFDVPAARCKCHHSSAGLKTRRYAAECRGGSSDPPWCQAAAVAAMTNLVSMPARFKMPSNPALSTALA